MLKPFSLHDLRVEYVIPLRTARRAFLRERWPRTGGRIVRIVVPLRGRRA